MRFTRNLFRTSQFIQVALISLISTSCSHKSVSADGPRVDINDSGNVISSFHLRSYDDVTLKNGLRVLLIEDNSLPYFSMNLLIRSGSAADPAKLPGVSAMVADLLDKGTQGQTATQVADELGQMGAEYTASATNDYTIISAGVLSLYQDRLLSELSKIVMQPAFSETEIARSRRQTLSNIERLPDSPAEFVDRAYDLFLFGSHPYGHPISGTLASVKAIKRKDIIQFYLHHYRPNNALLAVVGKLPQDIRAKVETAFGGWQARALEPHSANEFPPVNGLSAEVVTKSGLVQSQILIGGRGIRRNDPDFLPLRVANTILGGAFSSRLNDKIRVDLGLTYSISSMFDARTDEGPFTISTFTRNEKVGETVSATLELLKTFCANGVTAEEVASAKAYLIGSFPSAIETAERLATNLLLLRHYGIPDSYLSRYIHNMNHISVQEVNRAIQKHFDPKNLKIVVYSDRAVVRQLKAIDPNVQVVPYTSVK